MSRTYLSAEAEAEMGAVMAKYSTPGSPVPGTDPEPGTDGGPVPVPEFPPMGAEPGTDTRPEPHPLYADIAQLLADGMPDPEAPDMLTRSDGIGLFYRGQVNLVFGDPESGKTWVALAAAAETLRDGGSALVLDLDHNGVKATIGRLLMLGAPLDALSDLSRFRYVEPEDHLHLLDVVVDVVAWAPDVTILDSIGELIPLFGLSSNSPDDFTTVHGRVLKPLAARAGTALIAIDHLAKNSESRAQGATGTAAKRRAIGGVSLRVSVSEAFAPGRGGSAALTIHKDRHGGLRAATPGTDREPLAAMFVLSTVDGLTSWSLRAPVEGERAPDQVPEAEDVEAIAALEPAPATVEEARKRLGWRKARAAKAMRGWREQGSPAGDSGQVSVPGSRHIGGNREPEPMLCPGCMEPSCDGDCEVTA